MAARRLDAPPWKIALGLGAVLFLLDACLVPSFVGWYDTGELLAATAALGISHPSGQALYHLLGKCFLAFPFGAPPWRLGLLSAAAGALASALFFLLACRLGERLAPHPDRPLSPTLRLWLAVLTLAWSLSLPWWTYAVTQLVYSLHLALILGALWIAASRHPRKWQGAALVLGAAVVFRPTQFFGLACLGALYFHETRRRRTGKLRRLAVVASFFLLGWSTALYLPLRSALHPAIAFAALDHPAALLRHLLALKFSPSLGSASPGAMAAILHQMARRLWEDLTPLGCLLSAWGIFLAWRLRSRLPGFFWAGAAWALLESLLVVSVPYPTFESHQFLYPWAFLGLTAALSLAWLSHLEVRLDGRGLHRVLAWKKVLPLLLGFWALAQLSRIGVPWDRLHERGAQDFARDVLDSLGRSALYVPSEENQYFPVVGYQLAFGVRPDVEILEPGKDSHDAVGEKLRAALLAGRPVYLNRPVEGLAPGWRFKPEGPLLQIT
ncbi:MAG TPA: DUF2723 domain-containing protein, partial [bacterium]|nr:DUF2723 domain-containing protein [bacterium]